MALTFIRLQFIISIKTLLVEFYFGKKSNLKQVKVPITSSAMGSSFPIGRRPNLGAVMLLKMTVFSGGGPPLGFPFITMVSPELTC